MCTSFEPEPQPPQPADVASERTDSEPLDAAPPPPPPPCHGYAHGCRCPSCQDREQLVDEHIAAGRPPYTPAGKLRPRPGEEQPWEPRPPRCKGG